MHRIPTESTALIAMGYAATTQRLQIEFKDGRTYEYSHVPAVVPAALLSSVSKGRYFNTHIRGRFRFVVAQTRDCRSL